MSPRRIDEDCTLTYVVQRETWYASSWSAEKPAISVVAGADGGGCKWEFVVEQHSLSGDVLRLQMFGDALDAFADIPEFFTALRDQKPSSLAELRVLLEGIGAKDATERVRTR
jgi:hypothetical protein